MDWTQLDVHPRIISAVQKANIKSARDLFILSIGDLQKITQLSITDIYDLQKAASATLQKHSAVTALQLYREKTRFPSQHQKLGLGCGVLNNLLRGGLPVVGITELAGESSAGKTQIALQLCLSVQYPETYGGLGAGKSKRAVYICTEDAFPNKRLQQLIKSQHRLRTDVPADVVRKIRFGDNIFIEHTADIDMLTDCITKKLPILLLRGQVRLVVIDSIAALFRCEFAAKDAVVKAKHLQTIGAKLHQLSRDFTTPVFCINQVTDAMKEENSVLSHIGLQDKKVLPALGISWSNQLLMRLMVARTLHEAPPPHIGCILRTMEVIFAPHIARATCYYTVDLEGVKGIEVRGM
ncbi:DNA repair protein XRCC3 isoform X1 [Pyxicephalus adspersus]|uniref:DNA repair protein XRCC3 isoform X1 n=1 Tax=Pyxicephalus adspersus TaxID=30357 RepID=UPI003B5CB1DA